MSILARALMKLFSVLYISTACLLMPFTIWKFDWLLGVTLAFGAAFVIAPILILTMLARTKWH